MAPGAGGDRAQIMSLFTKKSFLFHMIPPSGGIIISVDMNVAGERMDA